MRNFLLLGLLMSAAPVASFAATCSGGANCTACSNCRSCGHCGKGGGTCSKCRPDLYQSAASIPPRRVLPPTAPASPYYNTDRTESEPSWVRQQRLERQAQQAANSRNQRQSARNVSVPAQFTGQCVGVTDGDTITVLYGNTPVRIRLQGIDAPESKQAFGAQSKKGLSDMVFGKVVLVKSTGKDRYGRVLGWISAGRAGGGTVDVNRTMARAGLAWWYQQYTPKDSALKNAQAEAKKARRGLWRDAKPVAPWEFRRGAR